MRCRHCNHRRGLRRERGAALIVAMLVFALATALVVAMKSDFERYFQRSANILLDEQAQAYLRGGEDLAAMLLIRDYDEDKAEGFARDDRSELWNTDPPKEPPPPYALDDVGWMRGRLEDLQGRFNLNSLASTLPGGAGGAGGVGAARFTAAQEQFIRLLQALGEPEVSEHEAIMITESIKDWLDEDQNPSADGAEDEFYSSRTPAHRTGNRNMTSVSELLAVAYMTPEIYQALRPWVTVWPPDPTAKLNIHTAPAMLLRTINVDKDLSPLSPEEGEALAALQWDPGFTDVNGFLGSDVFAGKADKMNGIKSLLGQESSYFLLQAEAEVAGRNMRLYSVLHRHNRKIDALARASDPGSL